MSEKLPKESNELVQVLNRINTLVKHGEAKAESAIQAENIPQLTEVYEGEPLVFISRADGEFPTLNEFVGNSADAMVAAAGASSQLEKMEALLAEMVPLIQAATKKAVQQKLIDAKLRTKLEAEIMQVLRERLQSLAVDGQS